MSVNLTTNAVIYSIGEQTAFKFIENCRYAGMGNDWVQSMPERFTLQMYTRSDFERLARRLCHRDQVQRREEIGYTLKISRCIGEVKISQIVLTMPGLNKNTEDDPQMIIRYRHRDNRE